MRPSRQVWNGRTLTISDVNPTELTRRIQEAVALRAYRIYERQGYVPGHELENWRRAESEVVRPLSCGFISLDDKLSLDTDVSRFQEGEIEICIEPHRLAVCTKERAPKGESMPGIGETASRAAFVFHVLNLPNEIDPSQVRAKFNGRCLEIDLLHASGLQTARARTKAA